MDWLWLIVVPVSGAITGGGIIGMVSIILRRYRRLQREREAFRERLYVQVERKYVPCLKCVPEGRLCPVHTAELIAELKVEVA